MPRVSRPPSGFTLIEVMVTVAIVGILAAVALPSYTNYLRRGELPEAVTYLSTLRVQMEQYYLDNRNYGSDNLCAPNGGTSTVATPTAARFFTFTCTLDDANAQSYTLKATGAASRTTGYDYTIDQTGARATTKYGGVNQTDKACWLMRGSEC
jgi:type IV pilus assembly protein PilE